MEFILRLGGSPSLQYVIVSYTQAASSQYINFIASSAVQATSSIYHCSSSAMQQHLSIHSFITDVPIHQLYLPISSSIASYPNHEVELAYHCLASVGASSSEGSSVLKSCSLPLNFTKRHLALTSVHIAFSTRHHYLLRAIALIIIYSSTSSIQCVLSVILALKNKICKYCIDDSVTNFSPPALSYQSLVHHRHLVARILT